MSKHTPGPWQFGTSNDYRKREVMSADGKDIAFCGGFPKSEAHANARLIAAAPDLLAALIECAERLQPYIKHTEDLMAHMQAHKAIAKATGEHQ